MFTSDNLLFEGASPLALRMIIAVYAALFCSGLALDIRFLWDRAWHGIPWIQRVHRLSARPWTLWDAGFIISLLFSVQYLLTITTRWALFHWGIDRQAITPTIIVTQSLLFHGLGLVTVIVLMRQRRLTWAQAWGTGNKPWGQHISQGFSAYLAIIPILLVIALLNEALLTLFHISITPQDVALLLRDMKNPWLLTYLCFFTLIVAPVFEEMLFRGILFPVLTRYFGFLPGLFLSAMAFGGIHFHLPSFIPLTAIACGFAIAYTVTESLTVAITMHSLFNGVNLLLLLMLKH